jgi:16S rRNA G966 N2-methylase RsmD
VLAPGDGGAVGHRATHSRRQAPAAQAGTLSNVERNTLYYGDNLDVLQRHVKDESIDLVYLDPPFNSNANYNVLFAEQDGSRSAAQISAFEDTWRWDQAAAATRPY